MVRGDLSQKKGHEMTQEIFPEIQAATEALKAESDSPKPKSPR